MASLQKLSIRGIRAFSPDDEEQVIEFCYPLTIIVGMNGCGKTTIIESLKYAVTGSLPPGVKSGSSFVHDPKACGAQTVKANVKLRLTNRAGKTMVVIRSLEVTQKAKSIVFKQLDGVIKTTDAKGQKVSMSHKCGELDKQIPELIGVNKSILEHVVFCHQEDSSWPLQEGAVLKKRFDEIFDSARYAKALDACKKTKKLYAEKVKDLKADVAGFTAHSQAAEGFREEVESAETKLKEYEQQKTDIKVQEARLQKENDEASSILEQSNSLEDDIEKNESEITQMLKLAKSKKEMMDTCFDDSVDVTALNEMLNKFDLEVAEKQETYKTLRNDESKLKLAICSDRDEQQSLTSKLGGLEAIELNHRKTIKMRTQTVAQMVKSFDLPLPRGATDESSLTDKQHEAFYKSLETKRTSMAKDLASLKAKNKSAEDKIQSDIGDLKSKQSNIEHVQKTNDAEVFKSNTELLSIQQKISSITRISKSEVDNAVKDAATFTSERDGLQKSPRLNDIPNEIKTSEDKVHSISSSIDVINENLTEMRRFSDQESAIEILNEQIKKEEENLETEVHELASRYPAFEEDLSSVSADNLKSLEDCASATHNKQQTNKDEEKSAANKIKSKQKEVTEIDALQKHNKKQLQALEKKQSNLTKKNSKIDKILKIAGEIRAEEIDISEEDESTTVPSDDLTKADPQLLLESLNTEKEEGTDFGSLEVNGLMIPKLLRNLMDSRALDDNDELERKCPCCMRSLDNVEVKVFYDTIKELKNPETSPLLPLIRSKANQNTNEDRIKIIDDRIDTINSSMADWNENIRVQAEIKTLKESIATSEEEYELKKSELDSENSKLATLQSDGSDLAEFSVDLHKLRDDATRIDKKKKEVKSKATNLSNLNPNSGGKSVSDLEKELKKHSDDKDKIMKEIQDKNKEMSRINKQLSTASSRATNAEKNAQEKREIYDKFITLEERRKALRETIQAHNDKTQQLKEEEVPVRQQLKKVEADMLRHRDSSNSQEEVANDDCNKFTTNLDSLKKLHNSIDNYNKNNQASNLTSLKKEIIDVGKKIKEGESSLEELQPLIDKAKGVINEQTRHKKNIESNISYRENLDEVEVLKAEVATLKDEYDSIEGADEAREIYTANEAKQTKLSQTLSKIEGKFEMVTAEIKRLKSKLNEKNYKNIDDSSRNAMIAYETTTIAVLDIDRYMTALDKALLKFHGMKIADINKIIRELWTLTYKGEDITNIRIVSGEEGKASSARSYNYRVVMSKGNTEMDMRGRCSAGQRVLASIVIRLALAETFCIACGVMTLDEPTTNLDYENKKGLAIALAQIIAIRASQHNFQIIVITHDEDFVSMLKNELSSQQGNFSMPEKYYFVSRKEGGDGRHYSKIEQIDWDEL